MNRITRFLISFSLFTVFFNYQSQAQLSAGDIAFIGYNTDAPDSYTFITLTDIPGNEVIYFTDEGVSSTDWYGTTEDHWRFTAPAGGVPIGTVIEISEATGSVVMTGAPAGASFVWQAGNTTNNLNLSAGDQILAYQAPSARAALGSVTFIAGVHGDDGNGTPVCFDSTTKWSQFFDTGTVITSCLGSTARSTLPSGLTNGTNAVALFPLGTFTGTTGTGTSERDNAKYTGILSGTANDVRAAINDYSNWFTDDSNNQAIAPSNYSNISITPSVLDIEEAILSKELSISPNPVREELHIKMNSNIIIEQIVLYDLLGKTVNNVELYNNSVDVSKLNSGMYLLKIITNKGVATKQIIKK